ncbi:DNA-binding response regulator, LytR/AlgR family [Tenacibaculum sp. MAR_2009_124]|uniref:LytR/AlgR family response regulator transcription factor n=1 Tax=Tenacibaculum sp. MAR_2009_124 TaxID=1250059 RepID=UPI00089AE9B3|nr:response regulator transcription factor [Tenacibaculum sp. MAR_2009_124]SED16916.1 DNA-binding response regulator, LytR/AlgR family [Tenacibaculum sp. MAR_2009_124]
MYTETKKILVIRKKIEVSNRLKESLERKPYYHVDVVTSGGEAIKLVEKNEYDLLLVDLYLNESNKTNGIDLIKYLSEKSSFKHVYISDQGTMDIIDKVKETNPSTFIIPPFTTNSIFAQIEIILNSGNSNSYLSYSYKGMQQQISLASISHAKSDGAYIKLFSSCGKQYFVRKSLSNLRELLPSAFIRIHKSILINKDYVQGYSSQYVKVNREKLPIGRAYKELFLSQVKESTFSF